MVVAALSLDSEPGMRGGCAGPGYPGRPGKWPSWMPPYLLAVTAEVIVSYFCSKGCKAAFDKDPEKFGSAKKS
jgi:hypothetical protein